MWRQWHHGERYAQWAHADAALNDVNGFMVDRFIQVFIGICTLEERIGAYKISFIFLNCGAGVVPLLAPGYIFLDIVFRFGDVGQQQFCLWYQVMGKDHGWGGVG